MFRFRLKTNILIFLVFFIYTKWMKDQSDNNGSWKIDKIVDIQKFDKKLGHRSHLIFYYRKNN